MKKQAEMLKAMNQAERRAGTCPVSRLYGHVTVFRWTRASDKGQDGETPRRPSGTVARGPVANKEAPTTPQATGD